MTERKPKTWAEYNELRRSNPRAYHKRQTQDQLLEDRRKLGQEGFYNTPKAGPDDINAAIQTLKRYLDDAEQS